MLIMTKRHPLAWLDAIDKKMLMELLLSKKEQRSYYLVYAVTETVIHSNGT
jgi:hypothetical protein